MFSLFLLVLISLLIWMTVWYFIAMRFRRIDLVDMVWWLSFGVIAGVFFTLSDKDLLMIPYICVIIWAVRLVYHIFDRLRHHPEDKRYTNFRATWGDDFWWKSYLIIFLWQGLFIAIISIPMMTNFRADHVGVPLFFSWIVLWIMGFFCEFFADRQMAAFRQNPFNKGKIIQSWLWAYSRHPNYFGEILMWISVWLMAPSFFWILSPLLLSYLIIFVTGIPLLEASMRQREGFSEYARKTSILIPLPPKK